MRRSARSEMLLNCNYKNANILKANTMANNNKSDEVQHNKQGNVANII